MLEYIEREKFKSENASDIFLCLLLQNLLVLSMRKP